MWKDAAVMWKNAAVMWRDAAVSATDAAVTRRSLCMNIPRGGWSIGEVESIYRLLPTVAELNLRCTHAHDEQFSLIQPLMPYSPPQHLPNLRNIRLHDFRLTQSQYELFVEVLSARQSELKTFRLIPVHFSPHRYTIDTPDAGIDAALRLLVADGMEIHVGPEEGNCI
ncbi:hypothetical protein B0H13DRAFT_1924984 [Mycena leptocephala]|nr:hypothetical protein B0H13DRAFT_1924984 [Mycena leptocephala]